MAWDVGWGAPVGAAARPPAPPQAEAVFVPRIATLLPQSEGYPRLFNHARPALTPPITARFTYPPSYPLLALPSRRPPCRVVWRGDSELVGQWMSTPSSSRSSVHSRIQPRESRSSGSALSGEQEGSGRVQGQACRSRPRARPPPAAADRAQGSHRAASSPIDAEADDPKAPRHLNMDAAPTPPFLDDRARH